MKSCKDYLTLNSQFNLPTHRSAAGEEEVAVEDRRALGVFRHPRKGASVLGRNRLIQIAWVVRYAISL